MKGRVDIEFEALTDRYRQREGGVVQTVLSESQVRGHSALPISGRTGPGY